MYIYIDNVIMYYYTIVKLELLIKYFEIEIEMIKLDFCQEDLLVKM